MRGDVPEPLLNRKVVKFFCFNPQFSIMCGSLCMCVSAGSGVGGGITLTQFEDNSVVIYVFTWLC